jgi:hypothetical protein
MARHRGWRDYTRDFAAPPSAYLGTVVPAAKPASRPVLPSVEELTALAADSYLRADGAVMVPLGEHRSVNSKVVRRLVQNGEGKQ